MPKPPRRPGYVQQAVAADATGVSPTPRADPVGLAVTRPAQAIGGMIAQTIRDARANPKDFAARAIAEPYDWARSAWDAGSALGRGRPGEMAAILGAAALPAVPGIVGKAVGREVGAVERAANPYAHLPEPPRVYHGTVSGFDSFDPAKLDPRALYGPGHYFTDDPIVAGGGEHRKWNLLTSGPTREDVERRMSQGRAQWLSNPRYTEDDLRIRELPPDPEVYTHYRWAVERREPLPVRGYANEGRGADPEELTPNVRPARVALRRPFDAEGAHDAAEALAAGAGVTLGPKTDKSGVDVDAYHRLFVALRRARPGFSKADLNDMLRGAEYDGITHTGGANTGSEPHKVTIAFDRAQIRSPWGDWRTAAQFGAAAGLVQQATARDSSDAALVRRAMKGGA
jgi:hypothetical protein